MRYFITFACYGACLHGDESGSVDRWHNRVGSRVIESDPQRVAAERKSMPQPPYSLDHESRAVVLEAVQRHCRYRGWNLLAAHVRSNHVHAVVEAEVQPERVMNEFKSYANRALNRLGRDVPDRKRWARHGSTRWLWKDQDVRQAVEYVIEAQGESMALFVFARSLIGPLPCGRGSAGEPVQTHFYVTRPTSVVIDGLEPVHSKMTVRLERRRLLR